MTLTLAASNSFVPFAFSVRLAVVSCSRRPRVSRPSLSVTHSFSPMVTRLESWSNDAAASCAGAAGAAGETGETGEAGEAGAAEAAPLALTRAGADCCAAAGAAEITAARPSDAAHAEHAAVTGMCAVHERALVCVESITPSLQARWIGFRHLTALPERATLEGFDGSRAIEMQHVVELL